MKRTTSSPTVKKLAASLGRGAGERKKNTYDGDLTTVISTGSTLLDLAISGGRIRGGGVPGGIIVEIFGPNQGGKTVLMCEIAGGVQRQGGKVRFRDAEARLNKTFAQLFDLKIEDCDYGIPKQVSDVFRPLVSWMPDGAECIGQYNARTKKCKDCKTIKKCKRFDPDNRPVHGIFIDSFAALLGELEVGDGEDKRGSARAKDFSQWLRKIGPKVTENNWLMVGSNQIRDKQDAVSFGKKTTTPCGKAIPHHCSLRMEIVPIEFQKVEKIIAKKKVIQEYGVKTRVKIEKSSVWKPHRWADIYVIYDYGIDDVRANLQYMKDFTKDTSYWTGDQSMEDAIDSIEADDREMELREAVIDLWEEIEEKFRRERKPKRRIT